MDGEVIERLRVIEQKLDLLVKGIEELRTLKASRAQARKRKDKLPPPTADETAAHRERFSRLYQRWMDGKEIEVHDELDGLELEQLRRFGDANNLNVTAKMSKLRILELISARFREKRQLHKPPVGRSDTT